MTRQLKERSESLIAEKQIIEADESVTQSIRKIQLFIRRHEDYWKDHVKQKIELEHRLEAML